MTSESQLQSKIETILFISVKPLSLKKIGKILEEEDVEKIKSALEQLMARYNVLGSGINLVKNNDEYLLATAKENAKLVENFLQEEITGELTQPALETLTVIAYRGPISKTELELIRGVNCSLIVRNLLLRNLIEAEENKKTGQVFYRVTFDFIKFLGVRDLTELPDYQNLSQKTVSLNNEIIN